MVKHTQAILSVFDHFVGFALVGLNLSMNIFDKDQKFINSLWKEITESNGN